MTTLLSAMQSGDMLAEAERRYELIAGMMDPQRQLGENERPITGTEMKALSIEADRLIHKIVSLRAEKTAETAKQGADPRLGKVVEFDAAKFRKTG